jgi:FSR family fosmidomycin resistance protein-like MFS transporter
MTIAANPLGRDLKVMGLVGAAHWASHFFQLALPPLFVALRAEFDVSYVQLGLVTSIMYGVSGIAQTAAGFLVDRYGARRVLLSGLTVMALSVMASGLVTAYWMLIPLAVLAGIGNSVFHPADLAILTSKVSTGRLGRAYGTHALCGNLGWAAAPVFVFGLAQIFDWRTALMAAGALGLAIVATFAIWGGDLADEMERPAQEPGRGRLGAIGENIRLLLNATIISCFLYFACLAMAIIGVNSFGVTALGQLYGTPLALANSALTGFLLGSAAGILAGGFAADQTDRHDMIAICGMIAAGGLMIFIGGGGVPDGGILIALTIGGAMTGFTSPSRDMLVRKATPSGASGRVFGFVYSGLDLGSAVAPLTLGWLADHHRPDAVFYAIAAVLIASIFTIIQVRKRTPAPA